MCATEIPSANSSLVSLCVLRVLCGERVGLGRGLLVEEGVVNVVFDGFDFDLLNLSRIRSALRPLDQAADLEGIALRNGFDGSIGAIAHPPGYLELFRALPH
jgi:hypothetical protein